MQFGGNLGAKAVCKFGIHYGTKYYGSSFKLGDSVGMHFG